MDQQKFDVTLAHVSNGMTLTRACIEALTTITHMIIWLSQHPNGKALHAALLQAEGDARTIRSDYLHDQMTKRINDGLVRTPQIAAVEQAEIARLRKEGQSLRVRAEKMLSKVEIRKQRMQTSWADPQLPQNFVERKNISTVELVRQNMLDLDAAENL